MTQQPDPRIAVLSALSSPGWHPVPEAHGMPWDEAEQLLAAYDASRTAAAPSAPADQAAGVAEAIRSFPFDNFGMDDVSFALEDDPEAQEWVPALAAAVLAVLPAPADRAAILREAADHLLTLRTPPNYTGVHGLMFGNGVQHAGEELRRMADEAQPWHAIPETEEEKLAKARRMAKALSAPPVAPPEWDATKEWPMRHKRARDRRVHATARFSVNGIQRIWTACGKQVGKGGYPMSHMPVDCRDCSRATTADEAQQPETQTNWTPGPVAVARATEAVSPTAALLASRCDACRHTLNRHTNYGGCTVALCVCGTFRPPVDEEPTS